MGSWLHTRLGTIGLASHAAGTAAAHARYILRASAACHVVQTDGLESDRSQDAGRIAELRREWSRRMSETEASATRKDAQLCVKYEWSYPDELSAEGCRRVDDEMARQLSAYGGSRCRVVVSQHRADPRPEAKNGNRHSHALVVHVDMDTGRRVDAYRARRTAQDLRHLVEQTINAELAAEGAARRIDARSYAEQGRAQEAGQHRGPFRSVQERHSQHLQELAACVRDGDLDRTGAERILAEMQADGAHVVAETTKRHGRQLYVQIGHGGTTRRYKLDRLIPDQRRAWYALREWLLEEQQRQQRERGIRNSVKHTMSRDLATRPVADLVRQGWRAVVGRDGRRWFVMGGPEDSRPLWVEVRADLAETWERMHAQQERRKTAAKVVSQAARHLSKSAARILARSPGGSAIMPLVNLRAAIRSLTK